MDFGAWLRERLGDTMWPRPRVGHSPGETPPAALHFRRGTVMEWWSWTLTAVGLAATAVAGRDRRGWLLCIGWEALWFIYGLTSKQWGFVASAALFAVVFGRNWIVNAPDQKERFRTALQEIRKEGKVCSTYETCRHVACASSYRAWAIADEALAGAAR